ncbi:MAG: hypothetical protein ACLQO1_24465 [Steroidobacteraceae bacterium]
MLLAAERAERVRVCALTITAAGTQTVIIGPTTINLVNAGVYTAVACDAVGGGAPYGLILLDDFALRVSARPAPARVSRA